MAVVSTQTAPPIRVARPEAEQIEALVATLHQRYNIPRADIRVVKAPLRICPLGAHIDHQLGLVTGMTIDQAILMAFAPTTDGSVHVESVNFSPPIAFNLSDVPPRQRGDWGNYTRGAVLALQQHYQLTHGMIGVIGGEMPVGGLSSSAAVTIAYLLTLQALNGLDVSPRENIDLVSYTENQYIGLKNGILDQSVILSSTQNHLTLIDCDTMDISQVPTSNNTPDFEILSVYSGVKKGLVGTDYNNRVRECQDAAKLLLKYSGDGNGPDYQLRRVNPVVFQTDGHRLPEPLQKRSRHYFGEMERVTAGVKAWQAGDFRQFGQLMALSGESSIKNYECGSPPLITLYEILRDTPGVYGARFSGAGFRGNCIALIDPAARESIAEAIHRVYPVKHPEQADIYSIHFCRPDSRAMILPGF